MPIYVPYPVNGKVYDTNGTTVLANVLVQIRNLDNGSTGEATSNSEGQYVYDLANLSSGYVDGDHISVYASRSNYYDDIDHTVNTSVGAVEINLTLDNLLPAPSPRYVSTTEVRNFTLVQEAEFSDITLNQMILRATAVIDRLTGRTWKGVQTVSTEYYDGNDMDTLWLDHTDLASVTALAIDDNDDGTYTSVTTSYVHVYSEGYITLDADAEVNRFNHGPKTVRITYTHGKAAPDEEIKYLCILMVANMMHYEAQRQNEINKLTEALAWGGPIGHT